jgi:alanyl-tRNA synthetase
MIKTLNIDEGGPVWEKLGPYSCQLNVDEVENIDETWKAIAEKIGEDVDVIKKTISIIRDLYIILDHCRTVFIIIFDGSLPSNVGGGSNVRNILRRIFALLKKNGWWKVLEMQGLLQLFALTKKDLETLYGTFKDYPSFEGIIKMEYEKYLNTDSI